MVPAPTGHAADQGSLLLDFATSDNTPAAIGTVTTCMSIMKGTPLVAVDVIAKDAVDWTAFDFLVYYPPAAFLKTGGPADGVDGGAFDFASGGGAENFMNAPGSEMDYSTTQPVPGYSPHGISMFDNQLVAKSGSGGMVHLLFDTSNLAPGTYTLALSVNNIFAGPINTANPPGLAQLGDFGMAILAVDTACPADSDNDGVSDVDEVAFGSNPNDPASTPESKDFHSSYGDPQTGVTPTCQDNADNDKDGQIDQADSGCTGGGVPANTGGGAPANTGGGAPANTGGGAPTNAGGGAPTNNGEIPWLWIAVGGGAAAVAAVAAGSWAWWRRRA